MIHANTGWSIIEYEKEESFIATGSGILIASARNQRAMVKGKSRVIGADPDANIPDLVRFGTLISGGVNKDGGIIKLGAQVLFNRHDAWGFTLDDTYFFAIRTDCIMGAVETDDMHSSAQKDVV